jgi:uncharacterized protein (TIGR02444 family)
LNAWDFAVSRYSRPEVEAACLVLQDEHGQCVPLLLWRLWAAAEGRPVGDAALAGAAALSRDWTQAAVAPLRGLRWRLKTAFPPVPDDARLSLRGKVQEAELTAERLLIEALAAMTAPPDGGVHDGFRALRDLVGAWRIRAPDSALRRLLEAAT